MTFLLGSDEQGRDMVSAIVYGIRTSVLVGLISTAIALAIGLTLGLLAAYLGGRFDGFIMRLVDIQLSFPPILIALILLALTGPGLGKIIVALVAVKWAYYARSARSIVARNTSRPPPAWACPRRASSSGTCCPTASRRCWR
jgi:peptide/nickel transport system permease protein